MNRAANLVAPFYAVEINRIANERERRGLPVIHMEVGQPSLGAPAAAIAAGERALKECPQGYWESSALAERIAVHYRAGYGLAIEPARILLTMGASAALVLAISVLLRTRRTGALALRLSPHTGRSFMHSGSCRRVSTAERARASSAGRHDRGARSRTGRPQS